MVLEFDRDLPSDKGASISPIRRQPGRGVRVALLLVGCSGYRQQVEGIIREVDAHCHAELLGPRLPRIPEGDDVIDLDSLAGTRSSHKPDNGVGVGIPKSSAQHRASVRTGLDRDLCKVTAQNVVSSVTPVVAIRNIDIITPGWSELLTGEARLRGAALDGQLGQGGKSRLPRR